MIICVTATGMLSGCGKGESEPAWQIQVDNCAAAPADQKHSFMAPIGSGPVELLIDDTFDSTQQAGIHNMVVQWNQLGQSLRGTDFFIEKVATVPSILYSANFANCDIDAGTDPGSLYLVNMPNETQWEKLGFKPNIPGATVRCYSNDYLDKQVAMVRPGLVDPTQFTSVVLHELGHALGLDHSCNSKGGSANFLSCNNVQPNTSYYLAVMYPSLGLDPSVRGTSSLTIKDKLQSNDTARASCFY